ncbi:hypothetical protein Tco_0827571 [Tanacetum coccineum]
MWLYAGPNPEHMQAVFLAKLLINPTGWSQFRTRAFHYDPWTTQIRARPITVPANYKHSKPQIKLEILFQQPMFMNTLSNLHDSEPVTVGYWWLTARNVFLRIHPVSTNDLPQDAPSLQLIHCHPYKCISSLSSRTGFAQSTSGDVSLAEPNQYGTGTYAQLCNVIGPSGFTKVMLDEHDDVKTAFLNVDLKKRHTVSQPEGLEDAGSSYARLSSEECSFMWLKQAPKAGFEKKYVGKVPSLGDSWLGWSSRSKEPRHLNNRGRNIQMSWMCDQLLWMRSHLKD